MDDMIRKITPCGRFLWLLMMVSCSRSLGQTAGIRPGCLQMQQYLPEIRGKAVGLVVNQTSLAGNAHLIDTLLNLGIQVKRLFSPEHGLRGQAADGAPVNDSVDAVTGIPIVSLYGTKKKPLPADLAGIEVMIYDIQDVGLRFYTYISTLHLVMEACAENNVPLLVLDRPNPNGHFIDGPVLEPAFRSFVGMDPVPAVYGMTAGEYALMINGEGWLEGKTSCRLKVIPCKGYIHASQVYLPVFPSPNLQTMEAVYLYPSLAFFEGTVMSVGRGTDVAFRVVGHPDYPLRDFAFTPQANTASNNPPHRDRQCFGIDLRGLSADTLIRMGRINLGWLLDMYRTMGLGDSFFISYFDTLAGTAKLREQITAGRTEEEIRRSWAPALEQFRKIRNKYLLYD